MQAPRDPFLLSLATLRDRLRSGRLVLGEQLKIAEIARELGLSATPVREALARLAGEGLIEERRRLGYFAWRLDAVDLCELYDLQAAFVAAALERARRDPATAVVAVGGTEVRGVAAPGPGELERTEVVLRGIVALGRSLSLERAHRLLSDRLAPVRRIEPAVLGELAAERAAIAQLILAADLHGLALQMQAYHARRRAAAQALIAELRSAAGRGSGE